MPWMDDAPYSDNMLDNPSAETGNMDDWTATLVAAVAGGVDGSYCFQFDPTAKMSQTQNVPGQPLDFEFEGYFLPAKDVSSAAAVKAKIIITFHYSDGSIGQYVVPSKSFL